MSTIWTIRTGLEAGRRIEVSEGLVVGRDPASGLPLADEQVSRRHAVVERAPEGLRLRDLTSTNGTFVNGRRVESALLEGEQEIRVGNVLISSSTTQGASHAPAAAPILPAVLPDPVAATPPPIPPAAAPIVPATPAPPIPPDDVESPPPVSTPPMPAASPPIPVAAGSVPSASSAPGPRSGSKRGALLGAGIGAALVVVGILVFVLLSGGDEGDEGPPATGTSPSSSASPTQSPSVTEPVSFAGEWSGTTSQGKAISLSVTDEGIVAVDIEAELTSTRCGTLTYTKNVEMPPEDLAEGGAFHLDLATDSGSSEVLEGTLAPDGTSSGTFAFTVESSVAAANCGMYRAEGTWEAERR